MRARLAWAEPLERRAPGEVLVVAAGALDQGEGSLRGGDAGAEGFGLAAEDDRDAGDVGRLLGPV
ncbi:hypothetical protein [Streptomyces sp. NBC_00827]|uniref:hypothetical protein n=1 Tax=Streptomyces sp. NBC_00827 TaxID=2903677 RepID=UPI00386E2A5B|nr:hypothetical protein OG569_37565 [Streptomyces sp. NBC_00827]